MISGLQLASRIGDLHLFTCQAEYPKRLRVEYESGVNELGWQVCY